MKELIITANSDEELRIKFDDERYVLVHLKDMYPEWRSTKTILLNPREIDAIVKFRNETKKGGS